VTIWPDTAFTVPDGGYLSFDFNVSDAYGGPLMAGTRIRVEATIGTLGGDIDFELPDTRYGATDFTFYLGDTAPGDTLPPVPSFVTVDVQSRNGNTAATIVGSVD